MTEDANDSRELFHAALTDDRVKEAATAVRSQGRGLPEMLALGCSLARACKAEELAERLNAELAGYQDSSLEIPDIRKVTGFASPFPVRALDQGVLLPEEIFLANREKFSQVTLTIGQPIAELETALAQIRQGGVLALRVPAAEITGASADTEEDTEVYIYILPREIQRIVDAARGEALSAVIECVVDAVLGPVPVDLSDDGEDENEAEAIVEPAID